MYAARSIALTAPTFTMQGQVTSPWQSVSAPLFRGIEDLVGQPLQRVYQLQNRLLSGFLCGHSPPDICVIGMDVS